MYLGNTQRGDFRENDAWRAQSSEVRKVMEIASHRVSSRILADLQVKLIKVRGSLVRRARRLVYQLAEVAAPRALFQKMLGRISRLCPAPG